MRVYNIYFDRKNPNSSKKLNTLKIHLNKKHHIGNIQNVLSHESALIQLTDFLAGIISYANRDYISRTLLSSWIKPIIMNVDDSENVKVIPDKNNENELTIELIHKKYRIHLKNVKINLVNNFILLSLHIISQHQKL